MEKISIHKFGGASVKNADAVKNIAMILTREIKSSRSIIVVSAMGKTTNTLEEVWSESNTELAREKLQKIANFHQVIAEDLGLSMSSCREISDLFVLSPNSSYEVMDKDARYDEIVAIGELASTKIVAEYLSSTGLKAKWWDVRDTIITDVRHRSARVDENRLVEYGMKMMDELNTCDVIVTQGFIGRSTCGNTTTLGREGSDYSAALLACAASAKQLVIWKDVQGMHNADPRIFDDTITIEKLDYAEALELSYYGASVIHPRTIKPLQNTSIPLYVKSFIDPYGKYSCISDFPNLEITTPMYISRPNITCLSLGPSDHSFVGEDHLQTVFGALAKASIHVRMMQNSAIQFEVIFDTDQQKLTDLKSRLRDSFWTKSKSGLELLTVRHGTSEILEKLTAGRKVLMEQENPTTVRRLLE